MYDMMTLSSYAINDVPLFYAEFLYKFCANVICVLSALFFIYVYNSVPFIIFLSHGAHVFSVDEFFFFLLHLIPF